MTDHFGNIQISPESSSEQSRQTVPQKKSIQKAEHKRSVRRATRKKTPLQSLVISGIICFIAISAAYLIAGYWWVPYYVRSTLTDLVSHRPGLQLQIDQVRFNPFSYHLELHDLLIEQEADSGPPLLRAGSIRAEVEAIPLLKARLITSSLSVEGLKIHLRRNAQGKFNYHRAFSSTEQKNISEILDFSDLPLLFSINNISVTDGRLTLQDQVNDTTHFVEKINLRLPSLSNVAFTANEYITPSFSAIINGSLFEFKGKARLPGGDTEDTNDGTELECSFNSINLPLYFGYLPDILPVHIAEGTGSGQLNLRFLQADGTNTLSIAFQLDTENLTMMSSGEAHTLKAPHAQFEGTIYPTTGKLHLSNLVLREPAIRSKHPVTASDGLLELFMAPLQNDTPSGTQQAKLTGLDSLIIDNGTFALGEAASEQHTNWNSIQFTLKGYRTAASSQDQPSPGRFRFSAESASGLSSLSWQGKFDRNSLPEGELKIDNLNASALFGFLANDLFTESTGRVDLQGFLSWQRHEEGKPFSAQFKEATITAYDLEVIENTAPWLKAPVLKFEGVAKTNNTVHFGSVSGSAITVRLDTASMPKPFTILNRTESRLTIDGLDIEGTLELTRKSDPASAFSFSDFSLQAIRLTRDNSGSDRDNLSLHARIDDKAVIKARGRAQLSPLTLHVQTEFKALQAQQLLPWFGESDLLRQVSGNLDGLGEFTYPDVSYSGSLSLDSGKLTEDSTSYFKWKKLDIPELNFSSTPLHFGGPSLTLVEPELIFNQDEDTRHPISRINTFFQKHISAKHDNPAHTTIVPKLDFKNIAIDSGTIRIQDTRLTPAWSAELTHLAASFQNLNSTPQSPSTSFTLSGLADTVPFQLNGSNHFFSLNTPGNCELIITDYPLPSFYEQLNNLLEIDFSAGLISLSISTQWKEGIVEQNNQIEFSNINPLDTDSNTALTLALLSGQDDTFSLSTSSQRPLDQGSPALLTDIVAAFKTLLFKASVSPLLLATGDFSDLIGNEYAEFLPGQIQLTGEGRESVASFSRLLSTHPRIKLVVTGGADQLQDTEALKKELEQFEQKRVEQVNNTRAQELESAIQEYMEQQLNALREAGLPTEYMEQEIPAELYKKYEPILPVPVTIDETMLVELANRRAQVIRDFFINELALQPDRIEVAPASQISTGEENSRPRVLFSIKASSFEYDPFDQPATMGDQ